MKLLSGKKEAKRIIKNASLASFGATKNKKIIFLKKFLLNF
jgi:hypothetical protein